MTTTNPNEFEDWYSILNVEQDATTTQIQNAYRKLAKKYHPDKNKSQEAVLMFEKITIANVTLCNVDKRLLFDSQLFAKREKKRKEHEMDNARKKMKQDLLYRENQFKKKRENDYNSQRNVQFENEQFKQNYINELRKQEQQQQAAAAQQDGNSEIDGMVIKLKWKSHLGYTQDNIMDILSSYGDVSTFTMVSSSSYTIALATFTQLESIYQILVRKDDLKNNYNIKIERLKGNNHTTTFNSSNGSTTTTTTSSSSSSSSSSTTTTTTTTTTSSSSSSNNNNYNNNNNFNNIIDEDEDDILLQMKNFKKK